MADYRILWRLEIGHDYFRDGKCRAIDLRVQTEPPALFRDRQLLMRKPEENTWELIGNIENGGIYTGTDRIVFEFMVKDPDFLYYTTWEGFRMSDVYVIDFSNRSGEIDLADALRNVPERKKVAGVLFSGCLCLSEEMYGGARVDEPVRLRLNFMAAKARWEYLFVDRVGDIKIKDLVLEEMEGKLKFSVPKSVSFLNGTAWRCESLSAIQMSECYDYQLCLIEKSQLSPEMKRKLVRNVGWPESGGFYDLDPGWLRKVVYF